MKIILNITIAIRPHKHIDRRDDPLSYLIKEIGLHAALFLARSRTFQSSSSRKTSTRTLRMGERSILKSRILSEDIFFSQKGQRIRCSDIVRFFLFQNQLFSSFNFEDRVLRSCWAGVVSASKRYSSQPGNELIIVIRGWKIACVGFIFLGIPNIVLRLIQVDIKAVSAACKWYFWYASPFWLVQAPFGASSDFF